MNFILLSFLAVFSSVLIGETDSRKITFDCRLSSVELVDYHPVEEFSISFSMLQDSEPVDATINLFTSPTLSFSASLTREALLDRNLQGYSALALRGNGEQVTPALFQIHLTMDPDELTASGFGQVIGLSDQIPLTCLNARGNFSKDELYKILRSATYNMHPLARSLRANGTL